MLSSSASARRILIAVGNTQPLSNDTDAMLGYFYNDFFCAKTDELLLVHVQAREARGDPLVVVMQ